MLPSSPSEAPAVRVLQALCGPYIAANPEGPCTPYNTPAAARESLQSQSGWGLDNSQAGPRKKAPGPLAQPLACRTVANGTTWAWQQ